MSKRKIILWLGILVALMPFLGFPSAWKTVVYFVSGALIAWNSFQLNKHKQAKRAKQERKRKEEITAPPAFSDLPAATSAAQAGITPPASNNVEPPKNSQINA